MTKGPHPDGVAAAIGEILEVIVVRPVILQILTDGEERCAVVKLEVALIHRRYTNETVVTGGYTMEVFRLIYRLTNTRIRATLGDTLNIFFYLLVRCDPILYIIVVKYIHTTVI